MTIVTKPLSEKHEEKGKESLIREVKVLVPEKSSVKPNVTQDPVMRFGSVAIGVCFMISLFVVCAIPIFGTLVRNAVQAEYYHDWCNIPIDETLQDRQRDSPFDGSFFEKFSRDSIMDSKKFFSEEFEIDKEYEKITVPSFTGGKRGKFIHDFKTNLTGIVDIDGHRCFVMPLNLSHIVPPDGLLDLLVKMKEGYYDVDTTVLRESMRVVFPALRNRIGLGDLIKKECESFPVYTLEKSNGVVKRSVGKDSVNFISFSGRKTLDLNIVNYSDLEEVEVLDPVAMA